MNTRLAMFTLSLIFALGTRTLISADPQFDLQAHRGGKGEVQPGNSLPAFEHAIDMGSDTLELDIRSTRDGALVIIHERYLTRGWYPVAGTRDAPKAIVAQMRLSQLKVFRHGVTFGVNTGRAQRMLTLANAEETSVPTLDELFLFVKEYASSPKKTLKQQRAARGIRFCIEMKEPGFEEKVVAILKRHAQVERVIIQSFNHDSIGYLKDIDGRIKTMALSALPASVQRIAEQSGADYWAPNYLSLDRRQVSKAHRLGLKVIPWTVNRTNDLDRVLAWGCDGVMTDFPSRFLTHLGRR